MDILANGLIPGPTNTAIWGSARPDLRDASAGHLDVRYLARLPTGGPTGRIYCDSRGYPFMSTAHQGRLAEASTD